jgi:hypothetical protein
MEFLKNNLNSGTLARKSFQINLVFEPMELLPP